MDLIMNVISLPEKDAILLHCLVGSSVSFCGLQETIEGIETIKMYHLIHTMTAHSGRSVVDGTEEKTGGKSQMRTCLTAYQVY